MIHNLSLNRQIHVPTITPGQIPSPSREIYDQMGEQNIFYMMADFYGELEKSTIRSMFPQDMVAASEKSAAFFVGLFGGPPLFHKRYGNPAMRARHMPFLIDETARQEWLRCFEATLGRAIEQYQFPAQHVEGFRQFLHGFSAWMVNTA